MNPSDVDDFYPLSPLQQGLLFHSVSDPRSGLYFNQTLVTLRGELDREAFERAWNHAVAVHAILRTFFVWKGTKTPVQVVDRDVAFPLADEDWRALAADEVGARIEALRESDLRRGFDLGRAPLMRGFLLRTADDEHLFLWSFHHILMDGWSMFTVLGLVFSAYDALARGEEPPRPTPRPYRDYIVWIHRQSRERAEAFWRAYLAGFDAPTPLPAVHLGGGDVEDFATLPLLLSAESTQALAAFAAERRLTLNTVVQGAWALLLARMAGEGDVVFGSVVAGRPADLDGVESMVGLFINSLPIRVRADGAERVTDWLRRLQAEQAELREYEYSALVDIQGWSEVKGGRALFDTLFMFENYHKDGSLEELCETLTIGDVEWFERHNLPLAALVIPGPELMLRLLYRTDLYDESTVARLLAHWRALVEGIVAHPNGRLDDLPLLERDELVALTRDLNDSASDYPRDATIPELFAEVAARFPDRVALEGGDVRVTYAELEGRANRIANLLRERGVSPGAHVGLCLERSVDLVVALFGILKAGGAYVPLDPDYPRERLELMLAETACPVVLTQTSLADRLPPTDAELLRLDEALAALDAASAEPPELSLAPDDLAYVMYTSGSTGRPKGTQIPHRAVVRLVRDTSFATFDEHQVFLLFATVSFDASTLELFGPLLNGGRLVVAPPGVLSLDELSSLLAEKHVTTLWLTAGLFHQWVERGLEGAGSLRQLLAGGDVLSVPLVTEALRALPECTVINGYGPTENTTFTCCHRMRGADALEGRSSVPIGRPIANTTVYLLDGRLNPVPIGVAGYLYAGGDGLARGYLGQPELTAERFVPNPFGEPGSRLYATGDRARYLPDGTIEFLGRDDFQVKVRGFRIELGEIETVLAGHTGVRDAVVLAREDEPGDKRLVAYVVPDGEAPSTADLRAFLGEHLPDHMVPSAFVALDAFPLTANGKVDRRALPAPDRERPDVGGAFEAPESELETTIAGVWGAVLGLERVGVTDNFFDLGGHSLALMKVHDKLKTELAREFPMVDLFQYPTVRALAGRLSSEAPEAAVEDKSAELKAGRSRLADLQRRRKRPS